MSARLYNLVKKLSKGGDTAMRARIILSVLTVLALAAGLVPSLAYAASEGTIPGSFVLGNVAPTIGTIQIYEEGDGTVAVLSPQTEYYIRVPVTDSNSLDDLISITVTLYYDTDGVYNIGDMPGSGNTQTCAIMTWTNLGDSWTIDAGGGSTTWSLVTANCSAPSMLATTGNFDFHFKLGKVAKATAGVSEWHVYAIARDSSNSGSKYATGYSVSWYGEIYNVTLNAYWSSVILGEVNHPADSEVSASYISNGNYSEQVKTNSPWSINGSVNASLNTAGTPGDKEFSLKASESANISEAIQVSTSYISIDDEETMTDDIGFIHAHNTLWLSLGSTGLIPGTYTGVVSYKIAYRP
jgi:hypothetical protein